MEPLLTFKAGRKRTLRAKHVAAVAALEASQNTLKSMTDLNRKLIEKLSAIGIKVKVDKLGNVEFEAIKLNK